MIPHSFLVELGRFLSPKYKSDEMLTDKLPIASDLSCLVLIHSEFEVLFDMN